jgi:hypothetical protein
MKKKTSINSWVIFQSPQKGDFDASTKNGVKPLKNIVLAKATPIESSDLVIG